MEATMLVLAGLFGLPVYAVMLKLTYDFITSEVDMFSSEKPK